MNRKPDRWITINGRHIPIFSQRDKDSFIEDIDEGFFDHNQKKSDIKRKVKDQLAALNNNGLSFFEEDYGYGYFVDKDLDDSCQQLEEIIGEPGNRKSIFRALKGTNPGFKNNNEPWYKYHKNCQRCVLAYEARRRGYYVKAKPKTNASDTFGKRSASTNYTQCMVSKDGFNLDHYWIDVGDKNAFWVRSNIKEVMKGFGDGSRAILRFRWKNKNSGHTIIVENIKGKICYIDPQSGEINCWSVIRSNGDLSSCHIVRIDDKQFTDTMIEAIQPQ